MSQYFESFKNRLIGATPPGTSAPPPQAQGTARVTQTGDHTQETDPGPTMGELFGGNTPGIGVGPGQHGYTPSPINKFGLGVDDCSHFRGGVQMGGNQMAGWNVGGGLVWGGGINGGGGGGAASVGGFGQTPVATPMQGGGGHSPALAGGMASNQDWMEMMGGRGGGVVYGGSTPTQHGQPASQEQHPQQQRHGGEGVAGALFPQTPHLNQAGGNGGATAAPNNNGGSTDHGPAQPQLGNPGDFPFLQALGDKVGNHDPAVVEAERKIQTDEEREEKVTALAHSEVLLYLYMPENSILPRIVHSPTQCPEDRVPTHSNMAGQTIVFSARKNVPLRAPIRAMWESKTVCIPSGTDAVDQRDDSGKFTWNENISGERKSLRKAFLFPSSLARSGVEWIENGLDVLGCYEDLCTKFPGDDQYPDLKEWLLGASQGTSSDGSALRLTLQSADQDEPQFVKWCQEILQLKKVIQVTATQPAPRQPTAPPRAAAPAASPSTNAGVDPNVAFLVEAQQKNAELMMSMLQQQQHAHNNQNLLLLNQFQHAAMGGGGGSLSASSTSGTSANRSKDTIAGILSLSHIKTMADLSEFWSHVWHSKKSDSNEKGQDAKKFIIQWAEKKGLPINKAFEVEDDVVWDWICGNFKSSKDYSSDAHKKLSPYSAMPVTTKELERRKKKKKAEDASANTRTLAEAVRIEVEKGELPSPPGDWDTLVKTIVVFTGMVAYLFGEANDLYEKLMEVIETLRDEEVERNANSYLGVRSRQIFWLILVESKRYCNQAHSAWEFQQQKAFPTCTLDKYTHLIKNASDIAILGFPAAWNQAAPQVQPLPAPAPSGGSPKPSNMHLLPVRVKQVCMKVRELFPAARMVHFVAAAGKKMSDLPKIRGEVTCYNYLMGHCASTCNFKHWEFADLQPAEYEEWIQVMETGAKHILDNKALPEIKKRGKRKLSQK